jgi:hypothetical protein
MFNPLRPDQGHLADTQNPAAQAYARQRLALAAQQGLIPAQAADHFQGDPAALWRAISAQIFAGGSPAGGPQANGLLPPGQALQLANGPQQPQPDPMHAVTHSMSKMAPTQLLKTLAHAKLVAAAVQHLQQLRPTQLPNAPMVHPPMPTMPSGVYPSDTRLSYGPNAQGIF